MKWSEARSIHQDKWLLFEAIGAYSKDGQRIVEEISVINTFDDGKDALAEYAEQHKRIRAERSMFITPPTKTSRLLSENGSELGPMVKLKLNYGLPFCHVMLTYKGKSLVLDNVLVDTGGLEAPFSKWIKWTS